MNRKNGLQAVTDLGKTHYNNLRQQQCALNMQIRLAMQMYDTDMRVRLEKELEEVNRQMREFGE